MCCAVLSTWPLEPRPFFTLNLRESVVPAQSPVSCVMCQAQVSRGALCLWVVSPTAGKYENTPPEKRYLTLHLTRVGLLPSFIHSPVGEVRPRVVSCRGLIKDEPGYLLSLGFLVTHLLHLSSLTGLTLVVWKLWDP